MRILNTAILTVIGEEVLYLTGEISVETASVAALRTSGALIINTNVRLGVDERTGLAARVAEPLRA